MMNCTHSEACPSCDDSPLSYTGNITGILTFALGLIVSFIAFITIIRGAGNEIQSLLHTVEETEEHIAQMKTHIKRWDLRRPNAEIQDIISLLMMSLDQFGEARKEAADHLELFKRPLSLCSRIRWWYMEKETSAYMARLDSHNQRITAAQLTLLLQ
jgi:hypothetical protein